MKERQEEKRISADPQPLETAPAGPKEEPKSKTPRVLSTSLGVVLAANLLLAPQAFGDYSAPDAPEQPKLVEWSTEAVKAYFDPNVDWNIPYPVKDKKDEEGQTGTGGTGPAAAGGGSAGASSPVVIHNGGGFGWDDLLLYHLIFNNGRSYSSSGWSSSHPSTYYGTSQPYRPRTFDSETFRNQPVAGSTVRPKTTASSGTFNTKTGSGSGVSSSSSGTSPISGSRTTSSSRGSIGSTSGGFGSSSSHSSGSSFGS
jgi:hypothetical protein